MRESDRDSLSAIVLAIILASITAIIAGTAIGAGQF
jgi:hypothetical protein